MQRKTNINFGNGTNIPEITVDPLGSNRISGRSKVVRLTIINREWWMSQLYSNKCLIDSVEDYKGIVYIFEYEDWMEFPEMWKNIGEIEIFSLEDVSEEEEEIRTFPPVLREIFLSKNSKNVSNRLDELKNLSKILEDIQSDDSYDDIDCVVDEIKEYLTNKRLCLNTHPYEGPFIDDFAYKYSQMNEEKSLSIEEFIGMCNDAGYVREADRPFAFIRSELEKLTYRQLQKLCKERGISARGKTDILRERLVGEPKEMLSVPDDSGSQRRLKENALTMVRSIEKGYKDPFLEDPKLDESVYPQTWKTVFTKEIQDELHVQDVTCIKVGCGGGKTKKTFEDIVFKYRRRLAKAFIAVASRRSVVYEFQGRMQTRLETESEYKERICKTANILRKQGINVINYLEDPDFVRHMQPGESYIIIISPESLYKIPFSVIETNEYFFCDESESVVRQLYSPFHRTNLDWNRMKFQMLFRSKYIVFADAFMSLLTQGILEKFLPKGRKVTWLFGKCLPFQSRKILLRTKDKILEETEQHLKENKRCLMVSSTCGDVEDIKGYLGEKPEHAYISRKNPLKSKINECVAGKKLVAFDSKLGPGVSIDSEFDHRSVILKNIGAPLPVDMAQLIERGRRYSSDITTMSIEGIQKRDGPTTLLEVKESINKKVNSDNHYSDRIRQRFSPNHFLLKEGKLEFRDDDPWVELFYLVEWQRYLAEKMYLETWGAYLTHQGYKILLDFEIYDGSGVINFGKYRGKTFSEIKRQDPEYCAWILKTKNEITKYKSGPEFIRFLQDMDSKGRSRKIVYLPPKHKCLLSVSKDVGGVLKDKKKERKELESEIYKSLVVCDSEEQQLQAKREYTDLEYEEILRLQKIKQIKRIPRKIIDGLPDDTLEEYLDSDRKDGCLYKLQRLAAFQIGDHRSVEYLSNVLDEYRNRTCRLPKGVNPLNILECGFETLQALGLTLLDREYRKIEDLYTPQFKKYLVENLDLIQGELGKHSGWRSKITKEKILDSRRGSKICSKLVNAILRHMGLELKSKQKKESGRVVRYKYLSPTNNIGEISDKILKYYLENGIPQRNSHTEIASNSQLDTRQLFPSLDSDFITPEYMIKSENKCRESFRTTNLLGL